MKKTKAGPPIQRLTILNAIGDCFQQVIQWSEYKEPSWSENVTQYLYQAEVLIKILEIQDCGSVGGFDDSQPQPRNLFDRWDWLFRKYNDPKDKKFGCNIASYKNIKAFFESEE